MIDLKEYEFQEPSNGKHSSEAKAPYLYIRNNGVIQFNAAVQRKHSFIAGTTVAFYSKITEKSVALIMVKDAKKGHALRGNAEKVNCSISDAVFAGKILLAVAAFKNISVSTIKKVELPVLDLHDKSGNYFQLDIDSCSVELIEK